MVGAVDNPESIYTYLGAELRQLREAKGLTLMELGNLSGVSYTHISEIERGKTCASLKTLEKLAKVLEVPISHFVVSEEVLNLGERIRRLRESHGLTQAQLGDAVGVSLSLITQIETGRVKPSLLTLQKIARRLGISTSYFLLNEGIGGMAIQQSEDEIAMLHAIRENLLGFTVRELEIINRIIVLLRSLVKDSDICGFNRDINRFFQGLAPSARQQILQKVAELTAENNNGK
ncbi:helix-turn-helix domain-containing protein [Thermanaerosceptrum fracticalcis]|uniref:Helix-turn-helix domain-containing protein n=1 Tax=Thermanaerosceptrum fracticalcis TaxID=1712410 RepID=A0A7G6E1U2_THEFR|nr:helix-turn-helix domain-containing protein [Thermanaerosceptrum fracticalcis]